MLKLGFDAKRLFHNFTGLGNYSRTLIENLQQQFPEYDYHLFTPRIKLHRETNYFLQENLFKTHTAGRRNGTLWRSWGINKDIQETKVQLFHGLSHELPINLQKTDVKTVVTIHDLIFKIYPENYAFLDRKIYDSKFRYACQNANRIIAISKSTKNDVASLYDIDPEKIKVIYQTCHQQFKVKLSPPDIQTTLQRYQLPAQFLLSVGSIIERKQLLSIVQAVAALPKSLQLPLVVIGQGKAYKKKVLQYIAKHKLESLVIFPKAVAYVDLPAIYQAAEMLVYPSKYEGFGIPLIEALFSKTPVVTTNYSSLPEAAGPGAFYADSFDHEAIQEGIEKVLTDEDYQQGLIHKGHQYVQENFSAKQLSVQLSDLYQTMLR
ncbi:MAG: glycosyltransferase family 4 protein [Saprospiraceae bacterium]